MEMEPSMFAHFRMVSVLVGHFKKKRDFREIVRLLSTG